MASLRDARLPEAFWSKVSEDSTGCWLWTGPMFVEGYGRYNQSPGTRLAHRVAFEALVGQVDDGLVIDHLCRVRRCVNPAHMEAVTNVENVMRGMSPPAMNAAATHCKYGHPFDDENTYTAPDGRRKCRTCCRDKARNRRLRDPAKYAAMRERDAIKRKERHRRAKKQRKT